MYTREPDAVLDALDDRSLRARLARTDWERDPLFVADEQVFSLFSRARAKGDTARIGLFAEAFNERLLERSRKFVLRARIFPGLIDDLKRATYELASCIWDQLLSNANDAAHAEKAYLFRGWVERSWSLQRRCRKQCLTSVYPALIAT